MPARTNEIKKKERVKELGGLIPNSGFLSMVLANLTETQVNNQKYIPITQDHDSEDKLILR